MGGKNWEMIAILQEIGQDMFSKTFLHTIVDGANFLGTSRKISFQTLITQQKCEK